MEILRDGFLQLFVHILRATDETHRTHAEATVIHGLLGGFNQTGVVAQAQIVVGAEVQHFTLRALYGDVGLLRGDDYAFVFVQTCIFDVLQLFGQMRFKLFVHGM